MCAPYNWTRNSRHRKEKQFPDYWMNDNRFYQDNAVFSANGKTLVKVSPDLTGEYIVPATVTRVLIGAFHGCKLSSVIFHKDVKTHVCNDMFTDCYALKKVATPTGESFTPIH